MTNTKITDLNEMTVPLNTDIIPIVDDPGGSPVNEKITVGNLFSIGGIKYLINRQTIALDGNEFTEVDIPSGTYSELEITITGAAMNAARNIVLLNFGNASIDTGANYWYRALDNFGNTTDLSSNYINMTRTAWAYNNDAIHSILNTNVSGLGANKTHISRTDSLWYYDRFYGKASGGWESADEILKVLVSLSVAGGWAAKSTCAIYGFR